MIVSSRDFASGWGALKAKGWRCWKEDEEWLHACPVCAAVGKKPSRPDPFDDPLSAPFAVLHLRQSAPRSLVEAAYRCLAREAHPDLNGGNGHDAMVELNEAVARIRASF